MRNQPRSQTNQDQAQVYQFKIEGRLDPQWAKWFDGMRISQDADGNTLLTGTVVDQAALHGLLRKIRDLGTPLIAVNRIQPDAADA